MPGDDDETRRIAFARIVAGDMRMEDGPPRLQCHRRDRHQRELTRQPHAIGQQVAAHRRADECGTEQGPRAAQRPMLLARHQQPHIRIAPGHHAICARKVSVQGSTVSNWPIAVATTSAAGTTHAGCTGSWSMAASVTSCLVCTLRI
jgi:hypothetical protein